ncbi:hypothetical protein CR513_50196, partial [Mucuna pruriens]
MIVLGCMNLDLALWVEKLILTPDNLQEKRFGALFFRVKGRENIREYMIDMSNLTAKLKSLNLELGEDLIVHLVLISLPTHFGYLWPFPYSFMEWTTIFITFIDDYSRYNIFKSFKAEVELQLGKKIKTIKSNCGGEYYGRYDELGEQHPRHFSLFLRECGIVS